MPSREWNLRVYRVWAPVYDVLLERFFRAGRQAAARMLDLQRGERVLLVGVGTGLDLAYLPAGVQAVGIDLSEDMLARARARSASLGGRVELRRGDAAQTGEPDASFDAAVLSLVLSVVPDPGEVLEETLRVLRPGGRAVVFDKFAPDAGPPSPARRLLNAVTRLAGTDIDRRLDEIVADRGCRVVRNDASLLGGQYRVALLIRGNDQGP